MGTLDEFVAERAPVWTELERLVDTAGSKPSRLGADGVRRLGTHVPRATAADLAIARRQFPGDPLLGRLERLVARRAHRGVPLASTRRHAPRVRRPTATGAASASGSGSSRIARVVPLRSRAARRLLGLARSRCGDRRGAGAVPVRRRAAHARRGLGRLGRRPGRVLERDLHEQHPRRDPRVRGRDPARCRRARSCCSTTADPRRDVRHRGRRRQRPTTLPTGPRARDPRAELHRGRGCGRDPHGLGDHRPRFASARRRAARGSARRGRDAARHRRVGSSSPGSSKASSRRPDRASATVLVVGVGLGVAVLGRRVLARPRPRTEAQDPARAQGIVDRHSRARAFSRRYAPTHASPKRAGDASITTAPLRRSRAATRVRASSTSSATAAP